MLKIVLADMFSSSSDRPTHTTDSLDRVRKLVSQKRAVLVDVREKGEWDFGHLRDAVLLPLTRIDAGDMEPLESVGKNKPLYLHCASGHRCLIAARLLKKAGYDVRPLKAGFRALAESGFPVAPKGR